MRLRLPLFSCKAETFAEGILIKHSYGSEGNFVFQSDCEGFLTNCQ